MHGGQIFGAILNHLSCSTRSQPPGGVGPTFCRQFNLIILVLSLCRIEILRHQFKMVDGRGKAPRASGKTFLIL